jgi:glutamine amidotransferase
VCRLYGFRTNELTKVECTLVHAQNALLIQSRSDLRGVSHADGWGIAYYADGSPEIERRGEAAYQDIQFSATAERVYAKTVLAHIRRATVGGASVRNTHPFRLGSWIFAHNGTITAFEKIRTRMEKETESYLQKRRQGSTDSEQAFLWLLSRMVRAGIDLQETCPDLDLLMQILGKGVTRLADWCEEAGAKKMPRLNFLLTDGTVLVGSRWNNTLNWVERQGIRDCEICGIPHVHHDKKEQYHAVVVASEPISHESWQEVPQGHVLGIDSKIRTRLEPI